MKINTEMACPPWARTMTRGNTTSLKQALLSGEPIEMGQLYADRIMFADDDEDDDDDDDGSGGGGPYQPDDEAMAWHNNEVKGLKASQQKALKSKKTQEAKAKKLEEELEAAKAELAALNAKLGEDAFELEERLAKLKEFEAGNLKDAGVNEEELLERGRKGAERKFEPQVKALNGTNETLRAENEALKAELHKHKYTGRLKSSMTGLIKKDYELPALATLEAITRFEDDDIQVIDVDGEVAVDDQGHPISLEEYMEKLFPKRFAAMCIKDTTITTNGPGGGGSRNEVNPWNPKTRNSTQQLMLIKSDPAKARKLMKQHNVDPRAYGL